MGDEKRDVLTQREAPLSADTKREYSLPQENKRNDVETTAPATSLTRFRDFRVVGSMPSQGAEADFFFLENAKGRYLLKLYRASITPVGALLTKIMEISKRNPSHLVSIFEIGLDEQTNRWYEIMEYIPTGSLQAANVKGVNKKAFVRALLRELAEAIHLLHQNDIIHCDIKPSNILIRSISPFNLVLTDFGIASQLSPEVSIKMTSLKGTPLYWAPEAFNGLVSAASDWWSLGVIALEYLAGSHPFAGLRQQQITYQLTVSNIEVPDSLGEETTLIRGLLTKDVKRRWGYNEIMQWLGGKRDIPVYYESKGREEAKQKAPPFTFEGIEILNVSEAAELFARDEQTWSQMPSYARYFLQWLEVNGQIDKAVQVAEIMEHPNAPDVPLFHFIHSSARLPFVYLGKKIDASQLSESFKNSREGKASPGDKGILKALNNGVLLELYTAYCRYNKITTAPLTPILTLLSEADAGRQLGYATALAYPDRYLWPQFPDDTKSSSAVSMLRELDQVPISRDFLNKIRQKYTLPAVLIAGVGQIATYSSSLDELKRLNREKLLLSRHTALKYQLPLNSDGDSPLSLQEYEKLAKKENWGFDDSLREKSNHLQELLQKSLKTAQGRLDIHRSLYRIKELSTRPITDKDRDFVANSLECIESYTTGSKKLMGVLSGALPLLYLIPLIGVLIMPLSDGRTFEMILFFLLLFPAVRKGASGFSLSSPSALLSSLSHFAAYAFPALALLTIRFYLFGMRGLSFDFILKRFPNASSIVALIQQYSYLIQFVKYGLGALIAFRLILKWKRSQRDNQREQLSEMAGKLSEICYKTALFSTSVNDDRIGDYGGNIEEEFDL